jgi:hypothetical protein
MSRSAPFVALLSLVLLGLAAASVAAFVIAADDAAPPEHGGQAGFRTFAATLQAALDRGDIEFFGRRMETTPVTCTAEDLQGGPGGPLCAAAGESFLGFPIGRWQSEGGIVPSPTVLGQLQTVFDTQLPGNADAFGPGNVRVYALDLAGDQQYAIITAIIERPPIFGPGDPLRIANATLWHFAHRQWRLSWDVDAYVSAEDFLAPCPEALDFLGGAWERYPDPEARGGPGAQACTLQ